MDILRGSGFSWVTGQGEGKSGDKGAQAWDRTPLRGGRRPGLRGRARGLQGQIAAVGGS